MQHLKFVCAQKVHKEKLDLKSYSVRYTENLMFEGRKHLHDWGAGGCQALPCATSQMTLFVPCLWLMC